jgi:NAD(P)H-hydrate repair Nnr-like enzyme with NAD(P)H-hydrate dehydratase domain
LNEDGKSYNAAVVIDADGIILKAALTGATHYEKVVMLAATPHLHSPPPP